jgi:phage tail-like protein
MTVPSVGTNSGDGWREWHGHGVAVRPDGRLTLNPDPVLTYASPRDAFGDEAADRSVVDVSLDRSGHPYVLTADGTVVRDESTREACAHLAFDRSRERPEGVRFDDPVALCVTDEAIYVAAGATPAVQAFERPSLRPLWTVAVDAADPAVVAPVRLVAWDDGVLALDRRETTDATTGETVVEGVLVAVAADGTPTELPTAVTDPVDVAVDGAGGLYVLGGTPDEYSIHVFDGTPDGVVERRTITTNAFAAGAEPTAVTLECLAVSRAGDVVVGADPIASGDTGLYRYRPEESTFVPVSGLGGGCRRLALWDPRHATASDEPDELPEPEDPGDADASTVPALTGPVAIDGGLLYAVTSDPTDETAAGRVVVFDRVARYRSTRGGRGPHAGRALQRFDAGEPGVEWHRVITDLSLTGSATQVRLRYYATDSPDRSFFEGFEALDQVGEERASLLRAARVLGVAGVARLSTDELDSILDDGTTDPPVPIPVERIHSSARRLDARWQSVTEPNPRDALFSRAVGRYLWIELELVGDEFTSPRVDSLRAFFPRESPLQYLPGIYRSDATSADFLERFLSLFGSVLADVEAEFDELTGYLDPESVPESSLPWLSRWLGIAADEAWPVQAQRELLATAPELFEQRGTRAGLLALVALLFTDVDLPEPSWTAATERADTARQWLVDEGFRDDEWQAADRAAYETLPAVYEPAPRYVLREYTDLDRVDSEAVLAEYRRFVPSTRWFALFVQPVLDDERRRAVERVVAAGTPAHAVGRVVELSHGIELGNHSYLGVNTMLPTPAFDLPDARLGQETVLRGRPPDEGTGPPLEPCDPDDTDGVDEP